MPTGLRTYAHHRSPFGWQRTEAKLGNTFRTDQEGRGPKRANAVRFSPDSAPRAFLPIQILVT